jgi:hypothetical protein
MTTVINNHSGVLGASIVENIIEFLFFLKGQANGER